MKKEKDIRLLYEAANQFYIQKKKQPEIVKSLGLKNRVQLWRLLREAERIGIFEINVNLPRFLQLEKRLVSTYSLQDARVIMTPEKEFRLKKELGKAAARYFEETLARDNLKIAIGGGQTLYEFVQEVDIQDLKGLKIFPLKGGKPGIEPFSTCSLASALSGKGNKAEFEGLPVLPDYMPDKQIKRTLKDPSAKDKMEKIKGADVFIIPIGSLKPKSIGYQGAEKKMGESLDDYIERGQAKAVVCSKLIDKEGKHIPSPLDDLVLSPDPEEMRRISEEGKSKIVCVSGGIWKKEAILAGLRGKLFNILITDEQVAEFLIKLGSAFDIAK